MSSTGNHDVDLQRREESRDTNPALYRSSPSDDGGFHGLPHSAVHFINDRSRPSPAVGWQALFDRLYEETPDMTNPLFNFVGWRSSYTGQPLTEAEMREWVESTVERIMRLRPQLVLELGCGAGLLLLRIAPKCEHYSGTDLSEQAVAYLERRLAKRGNVVVRRRPANDFSDFSPRSFDTVILNSVAQYFPSADYLLEVLAGAVAVTRSGGHVFIGDVRSLPLLGVYHTSVSYHQASPGTTRGEVRERSEKRIGEDPKLAVDPALFELLSAHWPRVNHVDVHLKSGRHHNEITRYRFDVVLHVADERKPQRAVTAERWRRDFDWQHLRQRLATGSHAFSMVHVPNARLTRDLRVLAWSLGADGPKTVGEMRQSAEDAAEPRGVDPQQLREFAKQFGWDVATLWSSDRRLDCYRALFRKVSE